MVTLYFGNTIIIQHATTYGGILCINSYFFLGGGGCLTSRFMFHFYPERQARLVKMSKLTEGRSNLDHDNVMIRYIWGSDGGRKCFSELIKNPDMAAVTYCLLATKFCFRGLWLLLIGCVFCQLLEFIL